MPISSTLSFYELVGSYKQSWQTMYSKYNNHIEDRKVTSNLQVEHGITTDLQTTDTSSPGENGDFEEWTLQPYT